MENYVPKPIDTSDVELSKELLELGEAIAENAHDIWAVDRQAEGWTYGPIRDEKIKETPCMVPYSKLPENEKDYDRKMAMNTLRLMSKLGYDLIRREETDLYKELLSVMPKPTRCVIVRIVLQKDIELRFSKVMCFVIDADINWI